jgi:hypothetical protein
MDHADGYQGPVNEVGERKYVENECLERCLGLGSDPRYDRILPEPLGTNLRLRSLGCVSARDDQSKSRNPD